MGENRLQPGPCSAKRACPVCGDGSPCLVRDNGDVECGELARAGSSLSAPRGWKRGEEIPGQLLLVLYTRTADPPEPRPGRRQVADDERKKRDRRMAREIWEHARAEGGVNHERLRAYLKARGILLERLPLDVVPGQLAWIERCPDVWLADDRRWDTWPAMVARISEVERVEGGKHTLVQTGLHRTFLARDGSPAKRAEAEGNAKKMLGSCGGRAIWLRKDFPGGVLVLAEGIETGLACQCSADVAGVMAYMAADYLRKFELPEALVARGGPVHTVLIAADLDRGRLGDGSARKRFVDELRATAPIGADEAESIAAMPTSERWAWYGASRFAAKYPWLSLVVRAPSLRCGDELAEKGLLRTDGLLADGLKKLDWLDVLNAAGPDAVRKGMLDGVDLDANRARAAEHALPASPEDGAPREAGGTRADASGSGKGGGDGPKPWVARASDDMPEIEEGSLNRARRYLWEHCRVASARRFAMARWAGKWLLFDGRAYMEVVDEELRSILWNWLQGFRHWKHDKLVALNPTARGVEDVVKALAVDTAVRSESVPCWLTPILDDRGQPLWGRASSIQHRVAPVPTSPRPDALGQLVFPSGRLDLHRLVNKKLPVAERTRLEPHTPDLFTTTCLPFDLPVQELQALLAGRDRDEIYRRLCPKFYGWLADASDGDTAWEDQVLKMLGDTIGGDRSLEKIFCVVGLSRGGKGILEDAVVMIVGPDNVASLISANLGQEFGLAHLVGKRAAIMPDAHLDAVTSARGAVEILKTLSGQGRIPIADKYEPTRTHKLGCRIWIFCNEEPDLRDDSAALAGRFVWLPITKGYQGQEDASIKAAVPGEAPGIMLLALEGAIRLWSMARRSIEMCQGGQEIYDEFQDDSAPIRKFVTTWLTFKPEGPLSTADLLTADDLYRAFVLFCEIDEHRQPLGFRKFCKRVKWQARPWGWTQRQVKGEKPDPKRPRYLDGWVIKDERVEIWKQRRHDTPQPGLYAPPASGPQPPRGRWPD